MGYNVGIQRQKMRDHEKATDSVAAAKPAPPETKSRAPSFLREALRRKRARPVAPSAR